MNSSYKTTPSFRYPFANTEYTDLPSLTRALAEHWDDGKNELFTGALAEYFKFCNATLSEEAHQAEKAYKKDPLDADWTFLEFLCQADDTFHIFYCKGKPYLDVKILGQEILQALSEQDFSECHYFSGILRRRILPKYKNQLLREARSAKADAILEQIEDPASENERTQTLNAYLLGYYLSGEVFLRVGDRTVKSISQLTQYMKSLLDVSYETFEDFCHTLIDYNDVLDIRFEAFLLALGKRDELLNWKNSLI